MWQVFRSFNIEDGLIQAIQALCENSGTAVLLNSQLGEFFKTTVGRRSLLSQILFNLLLEKIIQESLHDHNTSICIGGRPISHLRFGNDIDLMSGSNGALRDFTNKLVDRARAYEMEVSTEKLVCQLMFWAQSTVSTEKKQDHDQQHQNKDSVKKTPQKTNKQKNTERVGIFTQNNQLLPATLKTSIAACTVSYFLCTTGFTFRVTSWKSLCLPVRLVSEDVYRCEKERFD